ncbi:hypothetical protein MJA45_00940 [Paenibacillus aurantius]|uniref:Uncharacterized protein n=1 Tax=Paenibacillus aurantius TaxID=2918900 RepID=A0AA96LEU3_9BACL|nr:hypothetical protein [Paenibacillus aurantius]WJH36367.1 hypothetical protein N6H14_11450 [Paenibacillus sp. CC-CFT747]WNQ11673.1 hypothetical protein MJA45_00940 [Paenibacillus aurantius]
MSSFGQKLTHDVHFLDHIKHEVPVQVYLNTTHEDIGFVQSFSDHYIKMNDVFYNRSQFKFISRPGY